MKIDADALVNFVTSLVGTPSPSGEEGAVAAPVRAEMERLGYAVDVHGRPAHSSRPDLGVNAVEAMADVLRAARELELPQHPELGAAILVVTDVISRPYPAPSVLPDRCTATFDRRTLPGESQGDVLAELREAAAGAVAPHGATAEVAIGLDRFDAYTGTRVEAPALVEALTT